MDDRNEIEELKRQVAAMKHEAKRGGKAWSVVSIALAFLVVYLVAQLAIIILSAYNQAR